MPRATPDGMKVCSKCRENKPVGEFHRHSKERDGLRCSCKVCRSLASKISYAANPDKMRARCAAWRAANPDKIKAKNAAWRAANPEKAKAVASKWRIANPDKERARAAAWKVANPDKVRAMAAAWRAANPDKVKARHRRAVTKLPDYLVRQYLNLKDAPPELIELKRLQVQITRELKRQEQSK